MIKNCTVVRIKQKDKEIAYCIGLGSIKYPQYNCIVENCTVSFCDGGVGLVGIDSGIVIRGFNINNCINIKYCIYLYFNERLI